MKPVLERNMNGWEDSFNSNEYLGELSVDHRTPLKTVQKRYTSTLISLIIKCILPGTVIMSDGWRAYYNMDKISFKHMVVTTR
jgi:hypothetical protein